MSPHRPFFPSFSGQLFSLALVLLGLTACLQMPSGPATAPATAPVAELDAFVSRYHELGKLSGAVLVADGGDVVYEKAFGEAHREWHVANTPDTRFRIGSVTKQFTATLVLQLVEEGELELDATVREILPDYPRPQGDRVTVHHLLSHTSGVPSYTSLPDFVPDITREPTTPEEFLDHFASLDLEFEPGSEWRYSNSNYFLLGTLLEKVTGEPYDRLLERRILEPLGLDDSGYEHLRDVIERRASGYVRTPVGYERAPFLDTTVPYAAGMMFSTVGDLFRWDRALYGDGVFRDPETKELMFTPRLGDYGYGWLIRDEEVGEETARVIRHGGGIFGFRTAFWRLPERRATVIVMDNTSSAAVQEIARGAAAILLGQTPPEPKVSLTHAMGRWIEEQGMEAAAARFRKIREPAGQEGASDRYEMGPGQLNRLGYFYLRRDRVDTALEVFRLNVEAYPEEPNPHDSLGEAYLAAGEREKALAEYRTALELDPDFTSAKRALERLEAEAPAVAAP